MPDLRTVLTAARSQLSDDYEADYLLAHALQRSSAWIMAHMDDELAPDLQAAFEAAVQRRLQGIPVAYITGHRGFWTLDLEVGPATLIPRPDTETLVEAALARLPQGGAQRVADLGTGSGAIALALATERRDAEVWAVDCSDEALAVARRNARRHGLDRVIFRQGDWLSPLEGRFDMIVSNPPYIESSDPHLQRGDLRFEPVGALASGRDGLEAIRQLVAGSGRYLLPGGWLLLEHGWRQGPAVRHLMLAHGWSEVVTLRDLEDRDRVSLGRRQV
ncbi:peptide chain release factor N(5)-glutamine methyltransferase [Frateuria aurantia]